MFVTTTPMGYVNFVGITQALILLIPKKKSLIQINAAPSKNSFFLSIILPTGFSYSLMKDTGTEIPAFNYKHRRALK